MSTQQRGVLLCVFIALLTTIKAIAEKPSLAVMDCYVGKGVKSISAVELTDSVYNKIDRLDTFRLLKPIQLNALLKLERINIHDSLNEYKYWDTLLALRIALKLGVQQIIAGSVLRTKDSADIHILKIDTTDRRSVTVYSQTTDNIHNAIMQSINDGVMKLSRNDIDTSINKDIQLIAIVKTSPEILYKYLPEYSTPLNDSGAKGKVLIRALIGTDGQVVKAEIAKSSGHEEMDIITLAAMQLWKFKPALDIDDKPIAVWVMQPFRFVR